MFASMPTQSAAAVMLATFTLNNVRVDAADHSFICRNQLDYLPAHTYNSNGQALTCDQLVEATIGIGGDLEGEDFSMAYDCSTKSADDVLLVDLFAATFGCCGTTQQSACWKDHSHVCLNPLNYNGIHSIAVSQQNITCDTFMSRQIRSAGSPLLGEDFSQTYDCSAKPLTVTLAVNAVATKLGCCGTAGPASNGSPLIGITQGKGACWKDYSSVCMDRNTYKASALYTDEDGNSSTCDVLMANLTGSDTSPLYGADFSDPSKRSCVNNEANSILNLVIGPNAAKCCGATGRNACWKNYSHVCQDPAMYMPDQKFTDPEGDTSTCDSGVLYTTTLNSSEPLFGQDFTKPWSCDGKNSSAIYGQLQQQLAEQYGCCGDGKKSACSLTTAVISPPPTGNETGSSGAVSLSASVAALMTYVVSAFI